MTNETIYDAITNVRDELIEEAGTHVFQQKKTAWPRFAAIAAVLMLAVGIGTWGVTHWRANTSNDGGATSADGTGYSGYRFYAGPVLPLSAVGDSDGIAVERNTDWNIPHAHLPIAGVTDRYTLTNGTDEDKTVTLLYPSALSFLSRLEQLPSVTVNGTMVEAALYAGPFFGGFMDTEGQAGGERWNLDGPSSWEAYADLLFSDKYQSAALSETPELNQRVTVYQLDDYVVNDTTAVNPTLQMSFNIDYDKTTVLSYGSNGGTNEETWCARIVGGLGRGWREVPMVVILVGEDIDGYHLQGYKDAGCEAGDEIEISATVTRYETTLGEILWELVTSSYDDWTGLDYDVVQSVGGKELLYRCVAEWLSTYGPLGDDPAERYCFGMLEEMFTDVRSAMRLFYLTFEVTIPAGDSVKVAAEMQKSSSYDYMDVYSGKDTVYSFDLFATLGSTLKFTEQIVAVTGWEGISISETDYGVSIEVPTPDEEAKPAYYELRIATE